MIVSIFALAVLAFVFVFAKPIADWILSLIQARLPSSQAEEWTI